MIKKINLISVSYASLNDILSNKKDDREKRKKNIPTNFTATRNIWITVMELFIIFWVMRYDNITAIKNPLKQS